MQRGWLKAACAVACFVATAHSSAQGYPTKVGPRGGSLSGGIHS